MLRGGAGDPVPRHRLVADNPKALVGYSDITALHVAIRQRSGLAMIQDSRTLTVDEPALR